MCGQWQEVEHGIIDAWALRSGSGKEPQMDVRTLLWVAGSRTGLCRSAVFPARAAVAASTQCSSGAGFTPHAVPFILCHAAWWPSCSPPVSA